MEQVKHIKMSISRPGMSHIQIEFKGQCRAEDFPGIDDELRRKMAGPVGRGASWASRSCCVSSRTHCRISPYAADQDTWAMVFPAIRTIAMSFL